MAVPYTLGRRAKSYYNTGSYASPVWVPIKRVRDQTVASSLETVDASDRDSDYNVDAPVALVKSVTFQIVRDITEPSYLALEIAHDSLGTLDMLFLTGTVTTPGARGLRATMSISKFDEGHPYKGVQTVDVEVKPAPATDPPTRWIIP